MKCEGTEKKSSLRWFFTWVQFASMQKNWLSFFFPTHTICFIISISDLVKSLQMSVCSLYYYKQRSQCVPLFPFRNTEGHAAVTTSCNVNVPFAADACPASQEHTSFSLLFQQTNVRLSFEYRFIYRKIKIPHRDTCAKKVLNKTANTLEKKRCHINS